MNNFYNHTNGARTVTPAGVMPSGQVVYWNLPESRNAASAQAATFEAGAARAEPCKPEGMGPIATGLIMLATSLPVVLLIVGMKAF